MRRYRMSLKVGGRWELLRRIEADNHTQALRIALAVIQPRHYDRPLRLEEISEPANDLGDGGAPADPPPAPIS